MQDRSSRPTTFSREAEVSQKSPLWQQWAKKITIIPKRASKDQFTQANDTTFLIDPLLVTLGIIGTQREEFNLIASGTYDLPQGTPANAEQLIPLMQCPTEVKDRPQKLTTEQH